MLEIYAASIAMVRLTEKVVKEHLGPNFSLRHVKFMLDSRPIFQRLSLLTLKLPDIFPKADIPSLTENSEVTWDSLQIAAIQDFPDREEHQLQIECGVLRHHGTQSWAPYLFQVFDGDRLLATGSFLPKFNISPGRLSVRDLATFEKRIKAEAG
jgi:hypothetical protein